MKEQPSKEERKRLLIEMMKEDEKYGMYEKSDNELIAEFMGLEKVRMVPVILSDGKGTRSESPVYRIGFKELLPHQLKYDISWDHLMPVVEKISEYRMAYPKETGWVCDCKIVVIRKYLYREVTQFIKWYNSQQHERK